MRASAAQSQDAPAGLGDRAEEKRVLLQPGHGAGEGAGPGERDLVSTVFIQVLQVKLSVHQDKWMFVHVESCCI